MSSTGQPRPTSRLRTLLAVLLFATIILIAGCGSDSDPLGGSTTSTDPTTTTSGTSPTTAMTGTTTTVVSTSDPSTPVDTTHQAIIEAYEGYWDARIAANTGTPNPQDPALAQFATGNQLEAVIKETQENLDQGRAFLAAPNPATFRQVTVVSVDGDRAEVQECFVDDGQLIERATGAVINDTVATQSVLGTLRLVDGTWKVSGSDLIQRWEGVAGCALAS